MSRFVPALIVMLSCHVGVFGDEIGARLGVDMGQDDAWVYVVIPSADTLINEIEGFGQSVAPDKVAPGMIKGMLGGMLGDPGLQQLNSGQPIVLKIAPPADAGLPPEVTAIIPTKEAEPYTTSLMQYNLQSKFDHGLLIASMLPLDDAKTAAMTALHKKIAGATAGGSGIRIGVHLGRLMELYGPMIEGQMGMMTAMMEAQAQQQSGEAMPQNLASLMKIYVQAYLAALQQVDILYLDLDFQQSQLGGMMLAQPKPGSRLAGLAAPAPKALPKALALVDASAPFLMVSSYDQTRLFDAVMGMFEDLRAAKPELQETLTEELMNTIKSMKGAVGTEMAISFDMSKDGMIMTQATKIHDAGKALESLKTVGTMLNPGGMMGDMLKGTGVEYKSEFKENARKHNGVAVHSMTTDMDMEAVEDTENQEFLEAMTHQNMEMAILDDWYLAASKPDTLDAMVDHAKAKKLGKSVSMASAKKFGADQHFLMDLDWVKLIKQFLPQVVTDEDDVKEMNQVLGALTEPGHVMAAAKMGPQISMQWNVSLKPVAQMMTAIEKLESEKATEPMEPEEE